MDPVNSILSNLCNDVINHVTNNGEMEGDATRHAILVEQFSFFWGQLFDFFGSNALLVSFYLFVCFGSIGLRWSTQVFQIKNYDRKY